LVAHLPTVRCLLLDLRGHGDSEHVVPPAYAASDHAADLARLVRTLTTPYALAAHSAGALAAAHFVARTVRADGLVPPRALAWLDIDPRVPQHQVDYFRQRAPALARPVPAVDDMVDSFHRIYPRIPTDALRAFVREGLRPVDGGWRLKLDPATYATWAPEDLGPLLPSIGCPTLALRGEASAVSSVDGLAALAAGIPRCEVRQLPGASHLLLLEAPARVAQELGEFLARHAA
ncbi:MAG TPA: alpha/beta hydrolase, partial [Methylomirabilota bacterium]|nr:alpha/beta hydrolase [Methylomirabilota bacterium]